MTDTFWARVRAAFEAAADVPTGDRVTMLEAMSGGDARVLQAAADLLAADSENFLSTPPVIPGDVALLAARIPPGALIGDYRVVRLVGRGGMGEVYAGVRAAGDFDKRVAVKLLRAGMTSASAVGRFERERRILARLEHRNVASLLDGGVIADGTPYLVMEYVEGDRITDWCDRHRSSLSERLALFQQVCAAVSYAHRNLVVHRDLKPGNILVTADGSVKLLDFGIAKVLDADGAGGEVETRPEARALTREYAAPEHLTDGPITTGSDVYSLGLLLFELLTGRRPFAGRELSFVEYVRLVTTDEPPVPSTIEPPSDRGIHGARDRDRMRGDLDAIVLHALRINPAERYGTVEELANDLRRFEQGLPVAAVRGRRLYRARKFVRRNRGALATALLIAALLVAGAVATRSQARRANAERDRAEATNQFLTEMLQSVDPGEQGRGVLMSEVLDSAARRIDREPPREPEIEASLRGAIGASYMALGKYAAAEPHIRRALALRERHPGDVLALVNAIAALASLYDSRGEYVRADSQYHRALDLLPRSADSAVARRAADLVNQLARMQSQQGHYADAVKLLRQAIERESRLFGPASLAVARTTGDLGLTLLQKGDIAAADSAESSAIRMLRSLRPRDLVLEGNDLGRLATALDYEGNVPRSDSAYRASLAILDSILGPDHPDDTWIRYNYAGSLLAWGQAKPALAEAEQVLALRGRTLPETHPILPSVLIVKGQALGKLGDHAGAAAAIREALAIRQRYLAPDHWLVGSAESILGGELWTGGSDAEAAKMMLAGCRIMLKALGPEHPKTKEAIDRLRAAGQPADCR